MSRDELWRGLAKSAAAVQDAVEAFARDSTPLTRAAADAACRDYVQRLAPVIGEMTAFRYEASIRAFQDAIDRLDAMNATLAGAFSPATRSDERRHDTSTRPAVARWPTHAGGPQSP